jgi:ABC-type transport system involved in multi-copper enzyme maturation permease subunit
MFQDSNLTFIFGTAVAIASIILLISSYLSKYGKGTNELNKLINHFIISTFLFACLIVVLYFTLPSTPVLKSFDFPKDVAEIKTEKQILHLFQQYNKAIVRTTEVVHWFLFSFVWWFLANLILIVWRFKKYAKITFDK